MCYPTYIFSKTNNDLQIPEQQTDFGYHQISLHLIALYYSSSGNKPFPVHDACQLLLYTNISYQNTWRARQIDISMTVW